MIVISDTSPINFLCQIGHIEILKSLFGQVTIPRAVVAELSQPSTPQTTRKFVASAPDWVIFRDPTMSVQSLSRLGLGEQQAISLASELSADLLIIDDKAARRGAQQLKLAAVGTLGVLKLAAGRQLLNLQKAVAELQSHSFYVSDDVLVEVFKRLP